MSTDPVDDSKTVALLVDANTSITGWPSKTSIPRLVLRCQRNKTEAYVNTGFSPAVESGNLDNAHVTIRIDDRQARRYNCGKSTDNEALFFPSAIPLIRRLENAETMLFQFVPFNSDPQTTTFNVRGLGGLIGELKETCNWS